MKSYFYKSSMTEEGRFYDKKTKTPPQKKQDQRYSDPKAGNG